MRNLIGFGTVLVLSINVVHPHISALDVLGLVVIIPCLTVAAFATFGK